MSNDFLISSVTFVLFIFSILVHEIAHGLSALWLGDPTAKNSGRLTLNLIPHIDLVFSILIPGILLLSGSPFLIGGAKPVPVDPRYFKNPLRGMGIVAIAGPLSNAIISLIGILIFIVCAKYFESQIIISILVNFILLNIFLGCFNLIPVPPLDGGRIVAALLPPSLAYKYMKLERFGLAIVILLVVTGGIEKPATYLMNAVINFLEQSV